MQFFKTSSVTLLATVLALVAIVGAGQYAPEDPAPNITTCQQCLAAFPGNKQACATLCGT